MYSTIARGTLCNIARSSSFPLCCCVTVRNRNNVIPFSNSAPNSIHTKHRFSRLLKNSTVPEKYFFASQRKLGTVAKLIEGLPGQTQPYLKLIRADKPIGTWLLYWPCTWSIALAAPAGAFPDFYLLGLFGAGAFLMRGSGCIINDLWDRDFDKKVERTKSRPLACGDVSVPQALTMLGGTLSLSLLILLQLNWYSIFIGTLSMGLVVSYPLAKRFTYWPQFVLGLTFNWGALLGWTAVQGSLGAAPVSLYVSGLLWTLIYDTIYAHQDKTDDLIVGVKSSALRLGENTKPALAAFAAAFVCGLGVTGLSCGQTWPYYLGVIGTASHLCWQIGSVDINSPDDCWSKFRSNQWLGLGLFLAIIAGNLMKNEEADDNLQEEILD